MKFYRHEDFWPWMLALALTIFVTGRCAWVLYRAFIWVSGLAADVQ